MRTVKYRRKKEGRTNYSKRLSLLVSRKHRIVIRKSLSSILVQIVDYNDNGDKVILSTHSRELKSFGLPYYSNNISVAYLTGLLCGKKAIAKKIKEGIVDLGLQRAHPKGKLMAVIKGLVDAGMEIPCNDEAFPDDEKINGNHIVNYAKDQPKNVFTKYSSAKVDLQKFPEMVEKAKASILKK